MPEPVPPARPGGDALIDPGRHPLSGGVPPDWAEGWGQDEHGVFVEASIGKATLRLRWIPPGRFRMGSPADEPGRWDDEGPQVEITFAEGFWLMETPVTQALWMAVMGTNPSRFVSPDRPIESVSWNDAQAFLEQANARVAGLNLRLPSEAEWEYACRAGTTAATHAGAMEILGERNAPVLEAIAWYGGNSGVGFELEEGHDVRDWPERAHAFDKAGTRPVRGKAPTPWGCHDLLGNVWEWCADVWSDSHAGADPSGRARSAPDQEGERLRVVRGGSWRDRARGVRAAYRDGGEPVGRLDDLGFRCARGQAMESGRQAGGPEGRGRRSGGAGAAEPPAGRSDGRRAERGEERLRDGLE